MPLYISIRGTHDWGRYFDPSPGDDFLNKMSTLAPRDMRKALVSAFGNSRLARRCSLIIEDLPKGSAAKKRIGFVQ